RPGSSATGLPSWVYALLTPSVAAAVTTSYFAWTGRTPTRRPPKSQLDSWGSSSGTPSSRHLTYAGRIWCSQFDSWIGSSPESTRARSTTHDTRQEGYRAEPIPLQETRKSSLPEG